MSCACGSGNCGSGEKPKGCNSNGYCASGGCNKLDVFDWLAGMEYPNASLAFPFYEIRFKNTRKEYYYANGFLDLQNGDVVATEAKFGYDVGVISLKGELARIQMENKGIKAEKKETKKIIRIATQEDINKWHKFQKKENETLFRTRNIVTEHKLDMKISDVEYQGDGSKAIFYYTADDRVDFRELIKVLASQFKVRIEMKQIGARQEAGRVGGIGSCGRELCCSSWLTDFRSVTTSAARYQQLSINPLKLAGQCGKLKCCLNYELDTYVEALKEFPSSDKALFTEKGKAIHQKTDIFKKVIWYTYLDDLNNFIPVELSRVNEILKLNKQNKKPADLLVSSLTENTRPDFGNVVGQDDLNRFDHKRSKKTRKKSAQKNRNSKKKNSNPNPRK